jgi:hypothetical protein
MVVKGQKQAVPCLGIVVYTCCAFGAKLPFAFGVVFFNFMYQK